MKYNSFSYFRKGDDFLKSYWAKWSLSRSNHKRGSVQHLLVQTAWVTIIFKNLGLIRLSRILSFSHTRTTKAANSKAFTCKLRDNTTHSKGLITRAGLSRFVGWLARLGVKWIGPARSRHFRKEISSSMHEQSVTRYPVSRLVLLAGPPEKHPGSQHHNIGIPANRAGSVVI